jgi:hypothetical protein
MAELPYHSGQNFSSIPGAQFPTLSETIQYRNIIKVQWNFPESVQCRCDQKSSYKKTRPLGISSQPSFEQRKLVAEPVRWRQ